MLPYSAYGIIAAAANLPHSDNPPYDSDDFLQQFPQFKEVVPGHILDMYVQFANEAINVGRWHNIWTHAMGLFIAHWCTLWLQWNQNPTGTAAGVINAGEAKGLKSSKSVDGVAVTYDFATAIADLDGWAGWKLTGYGVQLATLGKMVGKGGIYVR